ncbi:hypothetical protein LTR08_006873 [Meristemomyces frigidus]|nr:hypothetical protein LTR08_006873 [Meristemomyces frigidus]
MATATAEYPSAPPFARTPAALSPRSPDTASPVYPDRAIRPLPRSRLTARLSPEQAGNLIYPPDPPPMGPTLRFSGQAEHADDRGPVVQNGVGRDGYHNAHPSQYHTVAPQHEHHHHHCTCGEDIGSDEDEAEFDHPDYRYQGYAGAISTPTPANTSALGLMNGSKRVDSIQRRLVELGKAGLPPQSAASVASSADGYESFENTSNKKKRKIPLSSALSMPSASMSSVHQSQLSAEMASMGISGQTDGAGDDVASVNGVGGAGTQVYTPVTPSSGTGISGAGRGRYGRQGGWRSGGGKVNGVGVGSGPSYGSRGPPRVGEGKGGVGGGGTSHFQRHFTLFRRVLSLILNFVSPADPNAIDQPTTGIISQAIKTAAEQGPLTPPKTNGNGKDSPPASLLKSATSNHQGVSTPAKTQFTFACESESGPKMEQHLQQQQQAAQAQQAVYATPTPQAGYANATYGTNVPGAYPISSASGGSGQGAPALPARGGQATAAGGGGGTAGGGGGGSKGMSTQGTQTTPSLRQSGAGAGGGNANMPAPPNNTGNNTARGPPPPPAGGAPPGQPPATAPGPAPPAAKPKTRRRHPAKEYALAARQRQLQQEYTNYHHRPTKQSMWICEFCEYEDIFGEPPVAMIRGYEVRAREERKREVERQRLLEKVRGRRGRGKKGAAGKGGKKGEGVAAAAAGQAPAAMGPPGSVEGAAAQQGGYAPGHGMQPPLPPEGEEYFDDEEEEDEGYEYGDEEGEEYEAVGNGPPPLAQRTGVGPG